MQNEAEGKAEENMEFYGFIGHAGVLVIVCL